MRAGERPWGQRDCCVVRNNGAGVDGVAGVFAGVALMDEVVLRALFVLPGAWRGMLAGRRALAGSGGLHVLVYTHCSNWYKFSDSEITNVIF